MSKKQLGSSVQVFCSSFNTEPVEIKWEYKTPTLRTAPNVHVGADVHVGDTYFDFKTYYRPMFTVNNPDDQLQQQPEQVKYREEAAFIPRVISVNFTTTAANNAALQAVNPIKTRLDERPVSMREMHHGEGIDHLSTSVYAHCYEPI